MDANQPITRAEFLKQTFTIGTVFILGAFFSSVFESARSPRRGGPNAYGNSSYGGSNA